MHPLNSSRFGDAQVTLVIVRLLPEPLDTTFASLRGIWTLGQIMWTRCPCSHLHACLFPAHRYTTLAMASIKSLLLQQTRSFRLVVLDEVSLQITDGVHNSPPLVKKGRHTNVRLNKYLWDDYK